MTFLELAKSRNSVRSFKAQPIEDEKMNRILEAGRVAPTACNYQPQKIYVAKSEDSRKKLASVCRCTFDAPVILVVGYDNTRDAKSRINPEHRFGTIDASIVCTHMMLEAAELGIGSCWVGLSKKEQVSKVLGLPKNITVVALMPIGYPADDAAPLPLHSQYRELDDTVTVI